METVDGRNQNRLVSYFPFCYGFFMKRLMMATITLGLTSLSLLAQVAKPEYLLESYESKPGQTVVTRANSKSTNGTITLMKGTALQKGTVSVKRQRIYERRMIGDGPTAKLTYAVLFDELQKSTKLGSKMDAQTVGGSLVGKTIDGLRDDMSSWRLFFRGKTANDQQVADLLELEAYENRRWFQSLPVRVGETWFFEASFIRNFIERDMGKALVEAKMTFKSVEVIDGEETAVLGFTIKSQASKGESQGFQSSSVMADLSGILHVSLATMLDKRLMMTGTLTTTVRQSGMSSVIKSPITYLVTKKVR